jgi:Skp family chaperone for outer membrane proteins
MDISTREGRAELLVRLLATAPAAFSHDMHTEFRAALRLLDERETEIEALKAEVADLRQELRDADREHAEAVREAMREARERD